jgi:SAM-dependent MidA family methyltransferase
MSVFLKALPLAAEKAESLRLCAYIRQLIQAAGGAIPFSQFMDLALYAPAGGYYTSMRPKLGKTGDFVTAPELSPLFSQCLARQSAEILAGLSCVGNLLEFGAGTGRMAGEILASMVRDHGFTGQYLILEPSGSLRAMQQAHLLATLPDLFSRFVWLDRLPEVFSGVILANEVIDAFPVERFVVEAGRMHRVWVDMDFLELRRPNDLPVLEALFASRDWPEGYTSEYHPQLSAWTRTLADRVTQGALLILDYGFSEAAYYHPDRHMGTLMCHYRHRAHADPYFYPGLQDISAHVNFSALAAAAEASGWTGLGYADQANFLIDLGLLTQLETRLLEIGDHHAPAALRLIQTTQTLLSPSEMGELIKVIAFGKKLFTDKLSGFTSKDRYQQLVQSSFG